MGARIIAAVMGCGFAALVAAPAIAGNDPEVIPTLESRAPAGAIGTCDVVGTEGDDQFGSVTMGLVVCGLGGNDTVALLQDGTFVGGDGDDGVDLMRNGVFDGGK